MSETVKKKYVPPDGKGNYRVLLEIVDQPLPFLEPGFGSASEALKWAKENVTETGASIHIVRLVAHKTSEAVPAKIRWK
jgi:hypothetical protein